jgi:membrane-bound ClpP family serine protease
MSLFLIIILILLGILLLVVEFLIIPGVTVAGIGGVALIGGTIYLTYKNYGVMAGNIVLLSTLVLIIGVAILTLRSRTWKKVMLDKQIDGKAADSMEDLLKPGDRGKAITRLAPMGNIQVGEVITEAKSMGEFITVNSDIEVVRVKNKEVIVKPLTK